MQLNELLLYGFMDAPIPTRQRCLSPESPERADKVTQNHNCDNSEHVGSAEELFEACSPFGCSAVMYLSAVESDPAGG